MRTTDKNIHSLQFLIGKWNTQGEIKADGRNPAFRIAGRDTYEWTLDKTFILHKVDVMMGKEKNEAIELIGEFDSETNMYSMRSFDNQGKFVTMKGQLDETDAYHITGDGIRSTLSVIDENNMSAHWEKLDDKQQWQPWMDLVFSK